MRAPVDVPVVLERTRMFEDLAAFVARIPAHRVGGQVEALRQAI